MIYLFWHKDLFEESNCRYKVEANSLKEAQTIFRDQIICYDEGFLSNCHIGGVNFGFAERFWIQGQKEFEYFETTGESTIDYEQFIERVRTFFGKHQDWADMYLESYLIGIDKNSDWLNPDLSVFKPFPKDMLRFLWDKFEVPDFEQNFRVISLDEIPSIEKKLPTESVDKTVDKCFK